MWLSQLGTESASQKIQMASISSHRTIFKKVRWRTAPLALANKNALRGEKAQHFIFIFLPVFESGKHHHDQICQHRIAQEKIIKF